MIRMTPDEFEARSNRIKEQMAARDAAYRIKRHLMKSVHGIDIEEIRS